MMITMVALTSCDGDIDGAVVVNDTSDSTAGDTSDSTEADTDDDTPAPNNSISEEALQALIDAFERSSQSESYTVTGTMVGSTFAAQNGVTGHWVEFQNVTVVEKIDGDKREKTETQTARYSPDGVWETQTSREFAKFTSENAGISYDWDAETSSWITGNFSYETSGGDSGIDSMGIFEEMYSQLQYDEVTGIYSLAEYNADDTALEFFFGRGVEIDSGEVMARYRNIEIELRDGYVYRYYVELDVRVDVVITWQGVTASYKAEYQQNQTTVITDYGTTVVTLPTVG